MTDIDCLWFAIEQDLKIPKIDLIFYSILADALEEDSQEDLSKTLKWMIQNNKIPIWWRWGSCFEWTNLELYNLSSNYVSWYLPKEIFTKLPNCDEYHAHYKTFKEAVMALLLALYK